ncbi:MAG: anthranilate phosphoribosyltransferase, partial [Buchnera aphidicola]|nr:anthranilate phosphoribosyltransferase [Buchnera aphidicola]
HPEDFGISLHSSVVRKERTSQENYDIIKKIMKGKGDRLYEELIAVNVAILLKVFGYEDLKKNTQYVLEKIHSGDVYNHIVNI